MIAFIMLLLSGALVAKACRMDLASWSEFFQKLFLGEYKDSKSVSVEDTDPAVLKELLHALYARKVRASSCLQRTQLTGQMTAVLGCTGVRSTLC